MLNEQLQHSACSALTQHPLVPLLCMVGNTLQHSHCCCHCTVHLQAGHFPAGGNIASKLN